METPPFSHTTIINSCTYDLTFSNLFIQKENKNFSHNVFLCRNTSSLSKSNAAYEANERESEVERKKEEREKKTSKIYSTKRVLRLEKFIY